MHLPECLLAKWSVQMYKNPLAYTFKDYYHRKKNKTKC